MPSRSKRTSKPRYILVIEDNVHHAELITELLDRNISPVIIHTVDSMDDGIEFAGQSEYDLILTDGVIADQPVTDKIPRLSELAGSTPIIVISGQGDEHLAAKLTKLGASEYLTKTRETLEKLPIILKKHLDGKKTKKTKTFSQSDRKKSSSAPSTPSEIIIEVDRLTQQALELAGPKTRKRQRSADDLASLDRMLGQLKRLRELASKLSK